MNKAWYYLYIESELWRCVWVSDLVTEILPEQCRCTLSNNRHIYVKKEYKKDSKEKMRSCEKKQDLMITTQLTHSWHGRRKWVLIQGTWAAFKGW